MTRERIEDMREVVLPFVKKRLLETNYENLGESDAEEFEREFNEILNLAIKALEQEPRKDEVILTKEEYGELVSSEFDNGYAKGYREALEQEPIDKIRAEIEGLEGRYVIGDYGIYGENSPKYVRLWEVLQILDKYKTEQEET